jgi:putative transposase
VIEHSRRRILHFNMTRHPTSDWVVQQLREAFPEASPYRYVILDRDSKFNAAVIGFLKGTGLKPKRTSVRSPWQNGIAERWVGSCRREILDRVIPLNEEPFRRLIRDYVNYDHDDRIHDSPVGDQHKAFFSKNGGANRFVPVLGGLTWKFPVWEP